MDFYKEYIRCAKDVVYFLENHFLKKKLYQYQRAMLYNFEENQKFLVNSCRQSGKTSISLGYAVWSALFHGKKALFLVHNNQMVDVLNEYFKFMEEEEYMAASVKNKRFYGGGELDIETEQGLYFRCCGKNYDFVILDEFAVFSDPVKIWRQLLPTLANKSSKVIILGTKKEEDSLFYSLYLDSKTSRSDFRSMAVNWWDISERDLKWKHRICNLLGKKHFDQEYLSDF